MFVSRSRFELVTENLRDELRDMRKRYWEVMHAHARLLDHLGLYEHEQQAKILLREKGGPEQAD